MTERISLDVDARALEEGLAAAGAAVSRLASEEIAPAAALIEDAFSGAARAIERDLGRAARAGSASLKSLARDLAGDLARSAIDGLVRKPLERALGAVFAAPFGGARAGGGPVAPGASYLVGERGPEIFTPLGAGVVSPSGPPPVNVSIVLPGVADAQSFRASHTQIAASLARVIGQGRRNS